ITADRAGETLYISARAADGKKYDIRMVSAASLRQRASFGAFASDLQSLTVSGDGKWLACRSWARLRVWRIGRDQPPKRPVVRIKPPPSASSFPLSHDGSRAATTINRTLSLWDTATGKRVAHSGQHGRTVKALAASPIQPILITGDNAGKVFLWDMQAR